MMKFRPGVGMINQWMDRDSSAYFLNKLLEAGASFVEFKVSRERWAGREGQILLALEQGLDVTFHASFSARYNPALFDQAEENEVRRLFSELFSRVAFIAKKKKSPALVNLHSAWGDSDADKNVLFARTARFLSWALCLIEEKGWDIRLFVELLPRDGQKIKVGDSPWDLIRLREMVKARNLSFCWDLGHFYLNRSACLEDGAGAPPPGDFLSGVGHVHAHDVCDGVDHNPLVCGGVPIREYLSLLNGTQCMDPIGVALELKYETSAVRGDPFELLFLSLAVLRKYIQSPGD
jgi:sugar phosphate isomerase/epimerase